jgi:hypothetical protein
MPALQLVCMAIWTEIVLARLSHIQQELPLIQMVICTSMSGTKSLVMRVVNMKVPAAAVMQVEVKGKQARLQARHLQVEQKIRHLQVEQKIRHQHLDQVVLRDQVGRHHLRAHLVHLVLARHLQVLQVFEFRLIWFWLWLIWLVLFWVIFWLSVVWLSWKFWRKRKWIIRCKHVFIRY